MLENLVFSAGKVAPYFLLILLGGFLRAKAIVPEAFFRQSSRFVFQVALPVNLFCTVSQPESRSGVTSRFLLFTAVACVVLFALVWGGTELLFRDKTIVGTLVQGAIKGNIVLLGVPLAGAVAGPSAELTAAFTIMVASPLCNMLSVVALTLRSKRPETVRPLKLAKEVLTTPLILAVLIALPFFLLRIPIPYFADATLNLVGQVATPLGLIAVGGMFRLKESTARLRPALYATAIKNFVLPLLALPAAVLMGFGGEELLVLFVLFAAPCAISSHPMAVSLNGDGPLASNILILTTLISAFVLAGGIYLLRAMGLI